MAWFKKKPKPVKTVTGGTSVRATPYTGPDRSGETISGKVTTTPTGTPQQIVNRSGGSSRSGGGSSSSQSVQVAAQQAQVQTQQAQAIEQQKAAEQQKAQEVIKQQTAFQKYREEVKQRGFLTTTGRYIGDAAVKGYEQQQVVKQQLTTIAQRKGVPTITPIKTARVATESVVLGSERAKALGVAREEAKKGTLRFAGEMLPTAIPIVGPLGVAGEQVLTRGGKEELKGTQESLQGLGVPKGVSIGLSYAPSVALAGVGTFQATRAVGRAVTKAQIAKAETDFIAQVKPVGEVSKVGYYAETKVGPRIIRTGGLSEVKEVSDSVSVLSSKSGSIFQKSKNIKIGSKEMSLGVTNKFGEVGKVQGEIFTKAPSLQSAESIKILTSAGEGTGTRVFTKTAGAVKINKQGGILFRQTPIKNVPRNPKLIDIAGTTKPTRAENVYSFKGMQTGSKLKQPSIRGFVEVLPETIEETSGGLVGITRQVPKMSLPKLESVTKQVLSEARSVAISKVKVPKVPKLVSPVITNKVETKIQPSQQVEITKQEMKQYQVPITTTPIVSIKQESYSGSKSKLLPRVMQETRQEPRQQVEQQTGQQTKQAQRQATIFRYPTQQKQQVRFTFPSIMPKTETIPFTFKLPKAQPFKLPKGSYGVEVRRGGKFYNIGTTKTLSAAIGLGKTRVSKTLAATYRIKGAKGLPLPTQKGFYSKTSKKNGLVFVEKRKFRLSKLGEKLEIQSAKRRKKK